MAATIQLCCICCCFCCRRTYLCQVSEFAVRQVESHPLPQPCECREQQHRAHVVAAVGHTTTIEHSLHAGQQAAAAAAAGGALAAVLLLMLLLLLLLLLQLL